MESSKNRRGMRIMHQYIGHVGLLMALRIRSAPPISAGTYRSPLPGAGSVLPLPADIGALPVRLPLAGRSAGGSARHEGR